MDIEPEELETEEPELEEQETAQRKHHTMRTNTNGRVTLLLNRKVAIQAKCTECMGWEGNPKDCTAILCPLYPFRGKTLRTYSKKEPQECQL